MKTLPTTIGELRVPNRTWRYFEHKELRPLAPRAAGVDLALAWWLAETALLVYVPENDDVSARLRDAGFTDVRFFEHHGTRALLAEHATCSIVCYRGTDIRDYRSLLDDATIWPVPFAEGGRVHKGFLAAHANVWDAVRDAIAELDPARPLFFTGHSLGGAMATIAARLAPRPATLYTFGSPRVGDRAFRDGFRTPVYRFVHQSDAVSAVPPPPFEHVGAPIVLRGDGSLADRPAIWENAKRRVGGFFANALASERGVRAALRSWAVDNTLADHAPIHYAVRVWNAGLGA